MNNEINCSHRKMEYACAFILPQTYENLFLVIYINLMMRKNTQDGNREVRCHA